MFRRKDDKYLIYLSRKHVPFKGESFIFVKVSFKLGKTDLLIEKWADLNRHKTKKTKERITILSIFKGIQ